VEQVGSLPCCEQVVVAGRQLVDQLEFERAGSVPVLAGGDDLQIDLWTVVCDESLEQIVRLVNLLGELGPIRLGRLAEHGHRSFELTAGDLLDVHADAVEQSVEVGHRGYDADRADHGERSRHDPIGHARHHVAAARCDRVHTDSQRHAALSYSQ
jgi:hypothetical protein